MNAVALALVLCVPLDAEVEWRHDLRTKEGASRLANEWWGNGGAWYGSADGKCRVGVLDGEGKPLTGFGIGDTFDDAFSDAFRIGNLVDPVKRRTFVRRVRR